MMSAYVQPHDEWRSESIIRRCVESRQRWKTTDFQVMHCAWAAHGMESEQFRAFLDDLVQSKDVET